MFRAKKYIENLQISIINGSSYGNILKAIEIAYLEGQVAVDIGCDDVDKYEKLKVLTGKSWGVNKSTKNNSRYFENCPSCGCNRTIPKTSSKMKCLNMNCEHYWLID